MCFVVDTLGQVSGHRMVRNRGGGDEVALGVARPVLRAWSPGRFGTRVIAMVCQLLFAFRLFNPAPARVRPAARFVGIAEPRVGTARRAVLIGAL